MMPACAPLAPSVREVTRAMRVKSPDASVLGKCASSLLPPMPAPLPATVQMPLLTLSLPCSLTKPMVRPPCEVKGEPFSVTLSKVAVAICPSVAAETARPTRSFCPKAMLGAVPKAVHVVPSRE